MSERLTGGRVTSSEYMEWAKTRSQARLNLASSGLMNYPLSALPLSIEDLELSGQSLYGYEPLQKALAAKCDAPPECVVAAQGTSMANHLAMARCSDRATSLDRTPDLRAPARRGALPRRRGEEIRAPV